jgi:hypothetical protein
MVDHYITKRYEFFEDGRDHLPVKPGDPTGYRANFLTI